MEMLENIHQALHSIDLSHICPLRGPHCKSYNAADGQLCGAAHTKFQCRELMNEQRCIWDPHDDLPLFPNANSIDPAKARFIGETMSNPFLHRIHESLAIKPDIYRWDDCEFLFAFN